MLGPNAQGEWRAATVKLRLVNKQYAVDRGLVAGHKFLHNDDARHEALPQVARYTARWIRFGALLVLARGRAVIIAS
jgi:hypothetical protein